ncbi:hypothetical protein ACIGMX_05525 [Streptomyces aquilus]|uniref:hypothetical protein n=1 Tax=Streptomyces aquilus TaxID=2548456 RepID=UPI0037CEC90D
MVSALVALAAWPLSYLAFRLRGGYFAVGTWVIAEVVRLIGVSSPKAVSTPLPNALSSELRSLRRLPRGVT